MTDEETDRPDDAEAAASAAAEVAVIGAGIGGLATAILLQRQGTSTVVYERREEGESIGAGIVLQPNGLAVLDAIGVVDELRAGGSELGSLRLLDGRLRPIVDNPVLGGPSQGTALVVSRSNLHRALLQSARAVGVSVVHGRRLQEIAGPDPEPELVFDDGAVAAPSLVVGADGQGSVVRRFVDPAGPTPKAGRAYVRALVDWVCVEDLHGEYWTRKGLAGILPCGPASTYFYCTATPGIAAAVDAGDLDAFRKEVSAAHPPLVQAVNALSDVGAARLDRVVEVQVNQLYRGPVALLGDAAHAMAPNLGQGANSALVDAGVLACEVDRRHGVGEALAAYDARRSEAVRRVQLDAGRLARVAHFPRARPLRNRVLRHAPSRLTAVGARRVLQVDLAGFRHELAELSA
ncbi:MAG: NAD(P)/FAD-dependent oxidoreductase [Actinomycetota bacterium]